MPQPKKAPRFGGSPSHHNLIVGNLTTELLRHGRIRTTLAKAKTTQPLAERMITFGKRGDLHARRQVLRVVRDKDVVHKLFADIGPAFADRNGGYTRVLKLGPRKGDAAPMALIELVEGVAVGGEGALEEAPRRRWSLRRRRGGSLSTSARERGEQEAAAFDRGEEALAAEEYVEESPPAPAPEPEAAAAEGEDEEAPQADPAEVEARLAAEEDVEDAAPATADEQDAPEAERPPDVGETTPAADEPEGGEDQEDRP